MDTGILKEFTVFAKRLNYTTAASELHISQPSLSRHVAELERELGVPLVTHGQDARLTYAGRILLEEADAFLAAEQRLRRDVSSAAAAPQGVLKVENYQYSQVVMNLVADVLGELTERYPGLEVEYVPVRYGKGIVESVLDGSFDVGVSVRTSLGEASLDAAPGTRIYPLEHLKSQVAFIVGSKSPLAEKGVLSVRDLQDITLLLPMNPEFETFKGDFEAICAQFGFAPSWSAIKLGSVSDLSFISVGDAAMAITDTEPDRVFLQNQRCAILPCSDPVISTHYLVTKTDSANSALGLFLNQLRAQEI